MHQPYKVNKNMSFYLDFIFHIDIIIKYYAVQDDDIGKEKSAKPPFRLMLQINVNFKTRNPLFDVT